MSFIHHAMYTRCRSGFIVPIQLSLVCDLSLMNISPMIYGITYRPLQSLFPRSLRLDPSDAFQELPQSRVLLIPRKNKIIIGKYCPLPACELVNLYVCMHIACRLKR